MLPFISEDAWGNSVFEWWVEDRKITMYPQDGMLLKIWGNATSPEIEEIQLNNTSSVKEAFDWLASNAEVRGF